MHECASWFKFIHHKLHNYESGEQNRKENIHLNRGQHFKLTNLALFVERQEHCQFILFCFSNQALSNAKEEIVNQCSLSATPEKWKPLDLENDPPRLAGT